ncbi:DUF4189 domain-containing protein [Xanthomonas euvesicatoria pv. allii]|uniref:DUF4189 domain-containing protein n=1 Tax=Xanthomonas euvesicatoria TaxID=456327 RepID=UPI002406FE05|nr:DUF4189 domain-containing protein [Xanthomonas euvesicatoria]MCP3040548.1 DUF4189 domain-containing protein [Xanthomonas euvesicatoria pv. allii]MCP3052532.1 DUF4189 domain-containing protein [Xanthomonas euvesicatoria pv. allii]
MQKTILALFLLAFMDIAVAEEGCPTGQIPAQAGGGPASCGPIPQGYYKNNSPRPTGKWIKTWGAIALGTIDGVPNYGVPTGLPSEASAKKEAIARCTKLGADNCHVVATYRNQCTAIGEPQSNGRPNPDGYVQFARQPGKENAIKEALESCERRNPTMQCKVIYSACSEPIFQEL